MSKLAPLGLLLAATMISACGSKTPAKEAENTESSETPAEASSSEPKASGAAGPDPITGEKPAENKPCEGFELDLNQVLAQAACEVPNPKPEDKARDMKGVLEIKVVASPNRVEKGGKADLVVYFANKGKAALPLLFTVDPEPRFQIEVYDKKTNKRVDAPTGNEPPLPESVATAQAPEKRTARATLVVNGSAQVKVPWEAVKYKWAPADRAKGAAPGRGYPKVAAGPLPKGKYTVKIQMPLVGVFEGLNHEVSAQQVDVEVQ